MTEPLPTQPSENGSTAGARVVVLAGPSGCGKTYLALRSGLPIITLDEFYRDGTDPGMPRRPDGVIDWEDPASWNAGAAMAALTEICSGDAVEIPTYAFGKDRAVGSRVVERNGSPVVIAEGIFAAELIGPLRDAGLLADAFLIRKNRWITFIRRLVRDMRDGRKGRLFLVRQGWGKAISEPAVVRRQLALRARSIGRDEALSELSALASGGSDDPVASSLVAPGDGVAARSAPSA